LYPKGTPRGLAESDFVWNGGNIYPLEIDGTEADCHKLVREIFADRALVETYRLTVANTANIGRLMPQTFFYPYAFSRLKKDVHSDIYYAMAPGNYSNLVAGLYSWRLSLPVNGFICPTTDELILDMQGQCAVMDGMIPFAKREGADPASPSNLERLEDVFHNNELMLKNLVFPMQVTNEQVDDACRRLFMKYGIFADRLTASAYAAARNNRDLTDYDESVVVLVIRDHPALNADYIKHTVGEMPTMPANVAEALAPTKIGKPLAANARQSVVSALESLQ
ncbi:MAG: threonine synthase, partial [Treponemataceae bacterium]|nr:threonine synthase [Treponemataceae bacterium]